MSKAKLHIGTKLVLATPMNRLDYTIYRGWDLPADEDGSDEGQLVEYVDGGEANHSEHKGYISWSPQDVFDNAYKSSGGMSFGMATEAAKRGYKVARSGWNGADMFVYIVPENKYPVTSPDSPVKGMFPNDMVPYRAYWALKTAQGDISTWSPSGSDSLADDWCVLD